MLQTNIHKFSISSRIEKQDLVFNSFPLLTVNFLQHIKYLHCITFDENSRLSHNRQIVRRMLVLKN